MPGLIDTHIHASQFPNAGLALDLTLLDWLQRWGFRWGGELDHRQVHVSNWSRSQLHAHGQSSVQVLISKARSQTSNCSNHLGKRADCARIHIGQRQILTFDEPTLILTQCLLHSRCVKSTLASGTTTACYFATIHTESTQVISIVTFASLQTDSIEVFLRNSTLSPCFLLLSSQPQSVSGSWWGLCCARTEGSGGESVHGQKLSGHLWVSRAHLPYCPILSHIVPYCPNY